jgi:hypothetical protein
VSAGGFESFVFDIQDFVDLAKENGADIMLEVEERSAILGSRRMPQVGGKNFWLLVLKYR